MSKLTKILSDFVLPVALGGVALGAFGTAVYGGIKYFSELHGRPEIEYTHLQGTVLNEEFNGPFYSFSMDTGRGRKVVDVFSEERKLSDLIESGTKVEITIFKTPENEQQPLRYGLWGHEIKVLKE